MTIKNIHRFRRHCLPASDTCLALRLPPLLLRLGVEQVGQSLDLREIQLAVVEGAPRELARVGEAEERRGRQQWQ